MAHLSKELRIFVLTSYFETKTRRTPVKQIAWNMLHEIWTICMMQQINIFQWNSAHCETRNICFLKYVSWNLLIMLREECCATLDVVVMFSIDSNGKNTTNCLKYVSLMCAELAIYRCCHEKTSYVSNYAFITSLHEWVDRWQMHQLEKFLRV